MGTYRSKPFATPGSAVSESVEHEQILPGELAVRPRTRVKATDDDVGDWDGLIAPQESDHITHVMMREEHQ